MPHPLALLRRRRPGALAVERELLAVVLERTGTPIVAFDRSATVTHASRGARALLGEAGAVGASPRLWIELLEPRTGEGLPLSVSDLPEVRVAAGKAPPTFDLIFETDAGSRTLRPFVLRLASVASATDAALVVHFRAVFRPGESI